MTKLSRLSLSCNEVEYILAKVLDFVYFDRGRNMLLLMILIFFF